eukprot:CAMPEP_0117454920 /NCGR_PEP_ID=MMETSP0759-20121206/11070_1 /TAXON_ID=63605 /ORGANISM="Percolomonas cosmopolitus, Strain WS" /LENGTH=278 /DNA_ID=CAMNT_0005248163 /DNA_START=217 /DNA_END=1053 /DNA_ORIENTATION=+
MERKTSRAKLAMNSGNRSESLSLPPILSLNDLQRTSQHLCGSLQSSNYRSFYNLMKKLLDTIQNEEAQLEKMHVIRGHHERKDSPGLWTTDAQRERLSACVRTEQLLKILTQTLSHCDMVLQRGRAISTTHRVLIGEISMEMRDKVRVLGEVGEVMRKALERQRELLRERQERKRRRKLGIELDTDDESLTLTKHVSLNSHRRERVHEFKKNVQLVNDYSLKMKHAKKELTNASQLFSQLQNDYRDSHVRSAGWGYDKRIGNARYTIEMPAGSVRGLQ